MGVTSLRGCACDLPPYIGLLELVLPPFRGEEAQGKADERPGANLRTAREGDDLIRLALYIARAPEPCKSSKHLDDFP